MRFVPMSVRISEEDQEFIAKLEVPGAATPSDKLRAIIAESRQRREGLADHGRCLELMGEMVHPVRQRLRQVEQRERLDSELLAAVYEWLPEAVATAVAGVPEPSETADRATLIAFEDAVASQVFRLMERVLLMGVTAQCRCYNQGLVAERVGRVLEICQTIQQKEGRR